MATTRYPAKNSGPGITWFVWVARMTAAIVVGVNASALAIAVRVPVEGTTSARVSTAKHV